MRSSIRVFGKMPEPCTRPVLFQVPSATFWEPPLYLVEPSTYMRMTKTQVEYTFQIQLGTVVVVMANTAITPVPPGEP